MTKIVSITRLTLYMEWVWRNFGLNDNSMGVEKLFQTANKMTRRSHLVLYGLLYLMILCILNSSKSLSAISIFLFLFFDSNISKFNKSNSFSFSVSESLESYQRSISNSECFKLSYSYKSDLINLTLFLLNCTTDYLFNSRLAVSDNLCPILSSGHES